MHPIPRVLVLPFLVLLTSFGSASVFAESAKVRLPYQLGSGADYQEGCFKYCRCAIWDPVGLEGSFDLVFSGVEHGMLAFDIPEITLRIEDWNGNTIPVAGSGRYLVRPGWNAMQSLELDVVRDGRAQRLRSGLVAAPVRFPAIEIFVNQNDLYCFDTQFRIEARPGRHGWPVEIPRLTGDPPKQESLSMGMLKSRF